ncbi:MAG: hypothetical protein KDK35_13385 [Leptospiraceae bacterium]|nr:hypothetical protein [Leptospiraceae bacterium]
MRFQIRGPLTIAGVIVTACGIVLALVLLLVLLIEKRPPLIWLLSLGAVLPFVLIGLFLLQRGLKELTITNDAVLLCMPGVTRRIAFSELRVVSLQESRLAGMNLILRGPGGSIAIPRNVSVFPKIEAALKERAGPAFARAVPRLPLSGDRRLEFWILIFLASVFILPIIGLALEEVFVSGKPVLETWPALLFAVVLGAAYGIGLYVAGRVPARVRFAVDRVRAQSVVKLLIDWPVARISELELRRTERSVKGMRFFEDDLYVTSNDGAIQKLPLRLIQSARITPRDLIPLLSEAWQRPVRHTEEPLFSPAAPPSTGQS